MTSRQIAFHVAGTPAPKGSMRAFTMRFRDGRVGARVEADNVKTARPWIALVTDAARQALGERPPFQGEALNLECVFALARPAGHFGKRGLRPGAPLAPQTKPDVDKLARQVGDALKGLLYDDDSRIVEYLAVKVYAGDAQATGAAVWLRPAAVHEVMAAEVRYTSLAGGGARQPALGVAIEATTNTGA
jgi:crossover junction endodeoxyribonuclease RusA